MVETVKNSKEEFSGLRAILWPVHNHEVKKFVPMCLLMFCILFVYTMVRDLKDVFIIKYAVMGAPELIPILKIFFVMPFAFFIVMVYSTLINKFGTTKTFYVMITSFMSFYLIFILFLFPNINYLHLNAEKVKIMQDGAPGIFSYIIPCLTNWVYSLFYTISETWGTIAVSSLFWQFANQVTKKNEVRRFYGLYPLIGNWGVIVSGASLQRMSKGASDAMFTKNVYVLISACIFFCLATMAVYHYIHRKVMTDPTLYSPEEIVEKKKKEKVSMMDGINILFKTPYLLLICALVIAYGVIINLVEVVWKAHMNRTFTDSGSYANMMSNVSIFTGIFTICATIFSTYILRRFSWKIAALIVPIGTFVFGSLFYILILYNNATPGAVMLGASVPILAVWVGLIADALSKSVKYCLFDPTKSMAYIPLDKDTKTKGQAAVEVIGGRAGKAGGAAVTFFLTNIMVPGSKIMRHLGILITVFVLASIWWISSVLKLSKSYEAKIIENK
ncbi:MAG: ATP/ADP translocase [Candidatus Paraimprobicoccus trichonymphae]|uniref:ADP,ATP carrier protein n=1 Tax=Candidatus Paraimprobicoccus trichonymphae TaxID=3033793 RepID=A0AA48KZT1_9FIRM|nr:MAG: ATP/ADP translocase [Candidatus Paraimprobicoccus trichonymphae]